MLRLPQGEASRAEIFGLIDNPSNDKSLYRLPHDEAHSEPLANRPQELAAGKR
jgi:hypothetical protein